MPLGQTMKVCIYSTSIGVKVSAVALAQSLRAQSDHVLFGIRLKFTRGVSTGTLLSSLIVATESASRPLMGFGELNDNMIKELMLLLKIS